MYFNYVIDGKLTQWNPYLAITKTTLFPQKTKLTNAKLPIDKRRFQYDDKIATQPLVPSNTVAENKR